VIYHHKKTGVDSYDLSDMTEVVRATTDRLRPIRDTFDSIVVTGMSGVLVGSPVALRLRKPLVVIRKHNDNTHQVDSRVGSAKVINLARLGTRALFLDDFTHSGKTTHRVRQYVQLAGASVVREYYYDYDELR
jgi:adenine/guanine phosphoribosyltransferase-like PRPP-binding protein